MKVKVFTLRLDADGVFDDRELVAFGEAHELLAVHEHLLEDEAGPAWGVLVTHRARTKPGARAPKVERSERDEAAEVPEADRRLFKALRAWRNERSKRDGKPAYVILRNRQLVDVARTRPTTLAALQQVHGIGEAKAQAYGAELLALVAQEAEAVPDAT